MAALGDLDLASGDAGQQLGAQDFQAGGLGLVAPLVHAGRLRGRQLHAVGQFGQRARGGADDLGQFLAPHFQVVLQAQFLGHDQIVAGLGLVGVGNGGVAQLEIALGRFQLPGDGGFFGLGGRQRVLGVEHVEVGVGHAQQQVLVGLLQLHLDVGDDELGLFVVLPAAPVEQGLGQGQVPYAAPAAVGHAQAAGAAGFLVGAAGLGGNQGQQQGARLRLFLQAGAVVGARRAVDRVIAQRRLPDLHQVLGARQRRADACGAGKYQ